MFDVHNLNSLKFPDGLKNLVHPNSETSACVTDYRDLIGVFWKDICPVVDPGLEGLPRNIDIWV